MPITGTVDADEARNFNQLTCTWTYHFADGQQTFTTGQDEVTNIAEDIQTITHEREYSDPAIQPRDEMEYSDFETLSSGWDDQSTEDQNITQRIIGWMETLPFL